MPYNACQAQEIQRYLQTTSKTSQSVSEFINTESYDNQSYD